MTYTMAQARDDFSWLGRVEMIHEIGRYTVVEYVEKDGQRGFGGVLDEKRTSRSYRSLEQAVVGSIAYATEGPNGRADTYFFRMLSSKDA